MDGFSFDCPCCGERHVDLPAIAYPQPSGGVDEFGNPWVMKKPGKDFCIFDDQYFFVRAVFEIPIIGESLPLEWGVWGSLSEANYKRYVDSFYDTDQAEIGRMFSYLSNELDGYPDSSHLECDMVPQNNGQRPILELRQGQDHPLVHEWTNGITKVRAIELLMPFLHPQARA